MIELTQYDKCFAEVQRQCTILTNKYKNCTNCAFYKPIGCKDWMVTVVDGVKYLMDPEEYDRMRRLSR